MGRDLAVGVGEGVEGLEDLLPEDLVLDADDGRDEDVVERLGLHPDIELLDAEGEAAHQGLERAAGEAEAGLGEAGVLPEALDDAHLGGADGEEALVHGRRRRMARR